MSKSFELKHCILSYCDLPELPYQLYSFTVGSYKDDPNKDVILCLSGWLTPFTIGIVTPILKEYYSCIAIKYEDYFIVVYAEQGDPSVGTKIIPKYNKGNKEIKLKS
jgi:hypothetical protein